MAAVLAAGLIASVAGGVGAPAAVVRSVIAAGGAPATGPGMAVNGTVGQSTPVGMAAGGGLVVRGGFWHAPAASASGLEIPETPVLHTDLLGNYPNPFNPQTRIDFELADPCRVSLEVYDAKGRLVRTLVDEARPAGRHHANWDGTDPGGRRVASGMYFFRLHAGDYESVMKMTLIK